MAATGNGHMEDRNTLGLTLATGMVERGHLSGGHGGYCGFRGQEVQAGLMRMEDQDAERRE